MQKTEVTQGQWKAVKEGNNSSYFKQWWGDDYPVENVSWDDVQEFILQLNQKEGGSNYRLPTEAEWEYAARSGTITPFYTGNCLSTDQANYSGDNPFPSCSKGEYRKKTVKTGSFSPNTWELYDMHGNVREWCQDWDGDYSSDSVVDPSGPLSGSYRVIRGGGWDSSAGHCRSAEREFDTPGYRYGDLGFRLVKDIGNFYVTNKESDLSEVVDLFTSLDKWRSSRVKCNQIRNIDEYERGFRKGFSGPPGLVDGSADFNLGHSDGMISKMKMFPNQLDTDDSK